MYTSLHRTTELGAGQQAVKQKGRRASVDSTANPRGMLKRRASMSNIKVEVGASSPGTPSPSVEVDGNRGRESRQGEASSNPGVNPVVNQGVRVLGYLERSQTPCPNGLV